MLVFRRWGRFKPTWQTEPTLIISTTVDSRGLELGRVPGLGFLAEEDKGVSQTMSKGRMLPAMGLLLTALRQERAQEECLAFLEMNGFNRMK